MKIRCFQLCETSGSHWHGLTLPLSLAQMSRPWVKRAWWHNCKFAGFCVLVVCQPAGLKGGDLRNQCFQGSLRFARSLGPDLAQRRSHFVPSREETNVASQISGLCTHPFWYLVCTYMIYIRLSTSSCVEARVVNTEGYWGPWLFVCVWGVGVKPNRKKQKIKNQLQFRMCCTFVSSL